MSKQIVFLLLLAAFLVMPIAVFAQNEETESEQPKPLRSKIFHVEKDFAEIKNEIKTKRIEAMQEMKTAREEFKQKLQSIGDTRKKNTVERIDTRLNNANQKHTDRLTDNLEKLSSVLERISSKAASLKAEGTDTSAVDTAITNAQVKIDAAEAAITAQAGKEYVITITDEASLRQAISPIVTQFRDDIKTTFQAVVDARAAVVEAARALKTITESSTTITPIPTL